MNPTKHLTILLAALAATTIFSGCYSYPKKHTRNQKRNRYEESSKFAISPTTRWTAVHYHEGGAPWEFRIDMTLSMEDRRIQFAEYSDWDAEQQNMPTIHHDRIATASEWRWIAGQLERAGITRWKQSYIYHGILDGTSWRLEFLDGTNIVGMVEGDNAGPKTFDSFHSIVRSFDTPSTLHTWRRFVDSSVQQVVKAPRNLIILDGTDGCALFAGETEEDVAFNAKQRQKDPKTTHVRNSLFLKIHLVDGTDTWYRLLTTVSEMQQSCDIAVSCPNQPTSPDTCVRIEKAWFKEDGETFWIVCGPFRDQDDFNVFYVCSYDIWGLKGSTFRILSDGESIAECSDRTLLVKNKKISLYGENGEFLGTEWYDEWINQDGTVVRKSEPRQTPSS